MRQTLLLLLILIYTSYSFCQKDIRLSYINYTLNNGLPSNELYTVFQDSKGFIWLGSDHGLARFDGKEFKTFTKEQGLTDNGVYGLQETKDGKIIANTFQGGLCVGDENGFKAINNNGYILNMNKLRKWRFIIDIDDKIWLNLYNYGVTILDPKKTTEFPFFTISDSLDFYFDKNDRYLFFAQNIKPEFSASVISGFPGYHAHRFAWKDLPQIYRDPFEANYLNGNVYLNHARDLVQLPIDRSKPIKRITYPTRITFVKRIENDLWVGLIGGGIDQYTVSGDSIHLAHHYFANLTITNAIKDKESNYWFSSIQSGVFFVPSIHFQNIAFRSDEFNKQRILCFQPDKDYLYACGNAAGQYRIDKNGDFVVIKDKIKLEDDITDFIVYKDSIISNTLITQVFAFNPFFFFSDEKVPFHTKLISKSPAGVIIAGYGGAVLMDKDLKPLWASQHINFSEKIESLLANDDSTYYLGAKGIIYHLKKNRQIDTFLHDKNLIDQRIKRISKINHKLLAVTTSSNGILLYDKTTKKLINNIKQGLASRTIEDLYVENDSTWWAATYNGISKINYSYKLNNYNILNLNTRLGLPSNEINCIIKFDDKIWAGTNNGIFRFDEKDLHDFNYTAPVFLTRMLVNNKPVNPDSISSFPFNYNNFEFEFTALSYRSLGKIRYEYRLMGLSDQWFTTEDPNIRFTGLKPGSYILNLRISDPSIYTYSKIISYSFHVRKPYYATTWFIILISAIIIGIVVLIVALYVNNIVTKSKSKYKILEAEQHALRSQMNPHFIFNVLNSIQASILENDKRNAVLFLSKFSVLIRRVLNNSKNPFVNLKEEIDVLRSYLEMEHFRMGDKLNFTIESELPLSSDSYSLPGFIIQPFIENAIWHGISPSEKKGKIDILFKEEGGHLICTIVDNGVGINYKSANTTKKGHTSIALKNIQERFDSLNKYMNIRTSFSIAEVYDDGNNVAGTRATIIFPLINETSSPL